VLKWDEYAEVAGRWVDRTDKGHNSHDSEQLDIREYDASGDHQKRASQQQIA
jgi:hypothetical protein